MATAYKHLKTPQNTGSGVADSFLFAPVTAFAEDGIKCPVPPVPPAVPTLADLVTISADHAFLTGEGFIEVICAPFKNSLTATSIGEPGSQKFDEKLEVFVPGSDADLHGTLALLNNQPVVCLIKDSNCAANMYYQVGCDCVFAWATAEFTTGSNRDGQKGYKVTFSCPSDAIQIYKGAIMKKPA